MIATYQRFLEIQDGKYGFKDGNGKVVSDCIYDRVIVEKENDYPYEEIYFIDGIARVNKDDKWGYINMDGKVIGDIKYKKVNRFGPDFAFVIDENNRWVRITRRGELSAIMDCVNIHEFSENVAIMEIKGSLGMTKYGFIDFDGNIVISPKYDYAEDFNEGYAKVRKGNKWGYIDKNDNWLNKKPRF